MLANVFVASVVTAAVIVVVVSDKVVLFAIVVSVEAVVVVLVGSVEVLPVVVVIVFTVDGVVESIMVVGTVGLELVSIVDEVVPWFWGSRITTVALLFFQLYTRHTTSTPIAVVITEAKRQVRKIFHRDQLLKKLRAS